MKFSVFSILILFFVSWGIGGGATGFPELWGLLTGKNIPPAAYTILLDLRLPRIIGALTVGAMLSGAGCAAQNIFRNDLASPHVLGCVNAAALGAVAAMLCGAGNSMMTAAAFVMTAAALTVLLIPGRRSGWESSAIILAGVAVNACCGALTSGALYLADEKLNSLVFWLLGGFWRMGWHELALLLPTGAVGLSTLFYLAPELDMLLLGDRSAALSGVNVKRVKFTVLLIIALLTAAAVSCCGVIGFVGLAVPHIVRRFGNGTFRNVFPRAAAAGALLLLLADLAARSCFAPREIPVGILTALAGGPFFFYLLSRRNHDCR